MGGRCILFPYGLELLFSMAYLVEESEIISTFLIHSCLHALLTSRRVVTLFIISYIHLRCSSHAGANGYITQTSSFISSRL